MKKFITTISLQGSKLMKTKYMPQDNAELKYDKETSFPIIPVIFNQAKPGDNIKVFPILINDETGGKVTKENYNAFIDELNALSAEIGFTFELIPIEKNGNDSSDTILKLFIKLIDCVENEDEISACITYGTKPISVVTIMALNYAYKVKTGVEIKNIVYGRRSWNADSPDELYDVTPLFYIDSAVNSLAEMQIAKPESALKALLNLED